MIISLIRTVMLYIIILIAMRLMGKRQISQLQTSELVVTLLISDIAAIPMQDTSSPMVSGLVPIFVLLSLEVILSFFMLKSSRLRSLICGKPIVIINKGKIVQENMKILRLSTEDLFEQLRLNNVEKLSEVQYAIIETNGMMSVIKRAAEKAATLKDIGIKADQNELEAVVVSDGEFADSSINLCKKSRQWVNNRLKEANIKIENVFIMTATSSGKYKIIEKEKKK